MEYCLIKLLPYILFEKYIYILALEMASPGNQHCDSCIGTLSFPIANPNQGDDVSDGSFRGGGKRPVADIRGRMSGHSTWHEKARITLATTASEPQARPEPKVTSARRWLSSITEHQHVRHASEHTPPPIGERGVL